MSTDYYAEAEAIARALASRGLDTEAALLREAIASGSTATEILMGLRWRLQGFVGAGCLPDEVTAKRARKLLAELDKELD
jgi:hypothetical protein